MMWICPQHRIPDEFRVAIHDTSNEFRLQLEGPFGALEAREAESCWRTAASTIDGRRFIVDVSRVGSLDAAAEELLSRMRESGAQLQAGAIGDNSLRLSQLPALFACLLLRLQAWARGNVPHPDSNSRKTNSTLTPH
jgi:alkylation response protein AidB-like acyl-CoA dehydrogenase